MSPQTALDAAACGLRVIWSAAISVPWVAAAVVSSAAVTLLVGRSLAMGIAVLLLAILVAEMVLAATDPFQRQLRLAGAIVSLVLIWTGCVRYRGRAARQRSHIAALEAEREAVQAKLDREITWRRAAEPEEDAPRAPVLDGGRPIL